MRRGVAVTVGVVALLAATAAHGPLAHGADAARGDAADDTSPSATDDKADARAARRDARKDARDREKGPVASWLERTFDGRTVGFAPATETVDPTLYAGSFDRPPVPHWRVGLPGGEVNAAVHAERSRPVVHGDRIYLGSAAGDALYALDRRNGAVVAVYPASTSVEAAALVTDDRVYFADTGGRTWCYTHDGTQLWVHDSAAPMLVQPALVDGRIYVTNVDDLVVALDADTGKLLWRYQQRPDPLRRAELSLYAAPRAVVDGDDVLVGFSDGSVVSLGRVTGDPAWTERVGEGRYPDIVGEPTVWHDLVFVSGYYEPLVAFDRSTRRIVWSQPYGAAAQAILVGDDEAPLVVHPGTDGKLRALQAATGKEAWTWDSRDSGALTEPVPTPAGLLVASTTGTVTLVDPKDGLQIWKFDPGVNLDGISSAPTVVGRQLLFVTNAGELYSFLAPAAPPVWPVASADKPVRAGRKARAE
ncbi:MAG: PQQ-binding-like beta-propeller repeat protein [Alphaproteobacteria bacterium]|nr:PQQ-binding-like beta-propeller repeat protein [Alphaproteobacteria bacterium]